MIEVKLHFPDHNALIAFFSGKPLSQSEPSTGQMVAALQDKVASSAVTAEKQAAARASTAVGKADTKKADPISGTAVATADDKPKKDAVDYPTLQKAVFDLVGKVKAKALDPAEHVLSIAKTFGYDNFAKMKEAGADGAKHFADALAAVTAKAAEVDALEVAVA